MLTSHNVYTKLPSQFLILTISCIFCSVATTSFDQEFADDELYHYTFPNHEPWESVGTIEQEFLKEQEFNTFALQNQMHSAGTHDFTVEPLTHSSLNWPVSQPFVESPPAIGRKPSIANSKKRQRGVVEKPFDIKPKAQKRAKKEEPVFVSMPGKENAVKQFPSALKPHIPITTVLTPLQVYEQKGITGINLLVNGESIESICGGPVFLPDFAQSIASNLHIAREADSLGCIKFNRKPTESNIQNILKTVQARLRMPHVMIPDGSALDDAVVFDRVKEVTKVLAGKNLDTFLDKVFFQESEEYLANKSPHRDSLENGHYRYFTRHMQFEIHLLEILRRHYPRQADRKPLRQATTAAQPAGQIADSYNIRSEVDYAQPRTAFQLDLIRALKVHLEKLPDPPRLKKNAILPALTQLKMDIADEMYSHADCIDQQNINNLARLAKRSLEKGGNRLDARHIVQQLAFRYTFNARYLLFQEHSGKIAMNSRERCSFVTNTDAVVARLSAEKSFARDVPGMFCDMIQFIASKGANDQKSTPITKPITDY